MKKNLSIVLLILFIGVLSAFTIHKPVHPHQKAAVTNIQFHFIPDDGSEPGYLDTDSWEVVSSDPECGVSGPDPCMISIDESKLDDVSDNQAAIASLVSYLDAQDGSGDFASPTAAVTGLTVSVKP